MVRLTGTTRPAALLRPPRAVRVYGCRLVSTNALFYQCSPLTILKTILTLARLAPGRNYNAAAAATPDTDYCGVIIPANTSGVLSFAVAVGPPVVNFGGTWPEHYLGLELFASPTEASDQEPSLAVPIASAPGAVHLEGTGETEPVNYTLPANAQDWVRVPPIGLLQITVDMQSEYGESLGYSFETALYSDSQGGFKPARIVCLPVRWGAFDPVASPPGRGTVDYAAAVRSPAYGGGIVPARTPIITAALSLLKPGALANANYSAIALCARLIKTRDLDDAVKTVVPETLAIYEKGLTLAHTQPNALPLFMSTPE